MDFHFLPMEERVSNAREGLIEQGFQELHSKMEVDLAFAKKGTTLVFVNSVCCSGEDIARPASAIALKSEKKPDHLVSVFAGQEKEATERAREYFEGYEPSSPAIALMKDGKCIKMVERSEIKTESIEEIASKLQSMFEEYC
ncbi:MAG: BrxA/BrxB family bacilliredoxin [Bacillales bacterium]|jgi:putative YphP/YqiW family bacilliredoxin|nr:BrxA/BrxB family bacilliredoxin [Bacillales bacterium]